tara:strand:- start:20509 stop:20754 length:246 start_codon:yes stop_codon:yes gene_type:complete
MSKPCYLDLEQARSALSEFGIVLNSRQMQRAAEMDGHGRRKLPFFIDPIDKKLKIDRNTLLGIYLNRQLEAENNALTPEYD